MSRFRFRLAQMERLRQAEEEMERRLLEERLTGLAQAEANLLDSRKRLADYSDRLSEQGQQPVPASVLANYRQWYGWLLDQVHVQASIVAEKQAAVDNQREKVRQARLRTKALEQLREKQTLLYRQRSSQEEQKQLDDLALQLGPVRMGDQQ